MDAKHTPGPWAYSTSDEGWTFSIYQADDAGFTPGSSDVATLFASTVQCDPKDTQEANARLIAAAPMLLAACVRARRGFNLLIAANDITDDESEQIALLDAAIATATQPEPTP